MLTSDQPQHLVFSEMKTLVLQALFPFGEKKLRFLSSVFLHLGSEKSLSTFNFKVHQPKEKMKPQKPARQQCQHTVLASQGPFFLPNMEQLLSCPKSMGRRQFICHLFPGLDCQMVAKHQFSLFFVGLSCVVTSAGE